MTTSADVAAQLNATKRSGRYLFIDLARAITVLMMVQGHALHVLLLQKWKENAAFETWRFLRGLTAPMFLFLSGFSFAVATIKYWDRHQVINETVRHRLRRFSFFWFLGYAMHTRTGLWNKLLTGDPRLLLQFLNVDVLQLIATSLIVLQLMVFFTRTPKRFGWTCFLSAMGILLSTPIVRAFDWKAVLWSPLAAYLYKGTGSQFPLFGWSAFVLLGAAMGTVFMQKQMTDPDKLSLRLLIVGISALGLGGLLSTYGEQIYNNTAYFNAADIQGRIYFLLLRFGGAMTLLAGFVQLARRFNRLAAPLQALAEESLVVYVIHLCIVYGSVWSPGMRQLIGQTLGPVATLIAIALLLSTMTALAYYWNRFKKERPNHKIWARAAIALLLVIPVL